MKEKICRLCLQTIRENYQTVGESVQNIFKLNLDISKEAVMCIECANNLEMFLKFKSACLSMREPTDLNDFNLDSEKIKTTNNLMSIMETKSQTRCCFCTNPSGEGLTSLNESKDHKFLVDVLKEHIPQLNLNIREELLTCETCLDGLQVVLRFTMKCLDVEQKINKYAEIKGMDGEGHIALKDVQQFILSNINELSGGFDKFYKEYNMQASETEIKSEIKMDCPELVTETEVTDIKSEQSHCNRFKDGIDWDLYIKPTLTNEKATNIMYQCNCCSYQTKNKHCLKSHLLKHKNPTEVTMYSCDSCSFQTKRKAALRNHLLIHKSPSEVTMYNCASCSFCTKHRSSLRTHLLVHKSPSEVTMYNCDSCSFQTKHKGDLKIHLLVHNENPSEVTMYKCTFCSFKTKRKSAVINHSLVHKSPSEVTMYYCDSCSFQTKHKGSLKTHLLVHKSPSEVTMYSCDSCSFRTKHKGDLKTHLLVHSVPLEVIMHNCEYCSYQTKHRGNLKKHHLVHKDPSEVTMHKCDYCSYQTKHKSSLKTHLVVHGDSAEVIMYKCECCSFQSRHKRYLKKHKLIHVVEPN